MAKQANVSDACLAALDVNCPAQRGQGASCLACVGDLARPPLACGSGDMLRFDKHFFCGEGWPSFSMYACSFQFEFHRIHKVSAHRLLL